MRTLYCIANTGNDNQTYVVTRIMSSRVANCICSTREQGTKRSTLKNPLFLSLQRKSEKACVGNGTEQGLLNRKFEFEKLDPKKKIERRGRQREKLKLRIPVKESTEAKE